MVNVNSSQDAPTAHLKANSLANVSLFAVSNAFPESVYNPLIMHDLTPNNSYVVPVGLRGSSTMSAAGISGTVLIDCLFNINGTSILNVTRSQNATIHPIVACPILNQTCDFSIKVF